MMRSLGVVAALTTVRAIGVEGAAADDTAEPRHPPMSDAACKT